MRIMKAFMDDLRTIRGVLNSILVLVVVTGLFLGLRACPNEGGSVVGGPVIAPSIEHTASGRVVIRFHADNDRHGNTGDMEPINTGSNESDKPVVISSSNIPGNSRITIPMDFVQFRTHRRHEALLVCRYESCDLEYRWYGWSFAPGLEISAPGAVGLDIRWAYVGDFSAISGLSYSTKEEQIQPSIGLAYNLKVIRYLKNTDLFVSYTPKGVIGGLRMELGD